MVWRNRVGTARLQTYASARRSGGCDTWGEFDQPNQPRPFERPPGWRAESLGDHPRRTATVDINGSPIFGEPKHGERRDVPIAPHVVEHLRTITMGRAQDAPLIDTARGNFVNLHNRRNRVWTKAVQSAGLQGRQLSPKALRHTAASMAIAAGADVKVVQRMLGHADASMTLNTYADLWPDRLDEVAEAVSAHRAKALRGGY